MITVFLGAVALSPATVVEVCTLKLNSRALKFARRHNVIDLGLGFIGFRV